MEDLDYNYLAKDLIDFMWEPENIFVLDWAVTRNFSKEKLSKMMLEDEVFKEAYDLAMTVQELKIKKGVFKKDINEKFAVQMMNNEHGWKGDSVNVNIGILNSIEDEVASRVLLQAKGGVDEVVSAREVDEGRKKAVKEAME